MKQETCRQRAPVHHKTLQSGPRITKIFGAISRSLLVWLNTQQGCAITAQQIQNWQKSNASKE